MLGVIPARGGSKGVVRKNIRPLAGKPLIAWTIESALAAGALLDRCVVSTDDGEIAELAREHGADVPFLRPAEIAGDKVPMCPVLQHATRFVEEQEGRRYGWVMLLQPTDPFRSVEDIAAVLELGRAGGCDSVISVVRVFAHHPILMKRIVDNRLEPFSIAEPEGTRRQDYEPPAYMRNGAIYLMKRDVLIDQSSLWGDVIRPYEMPEARSVSIDNEHDFKLAELVMAEQLAGR